mmetsp:Transcript_122293/g.351317  ORF Transcript_122293/g.351317 Transcript_122293/m.351317 type:complete len:348 (-) Transcript_122293:114-1157(-)
MGTYRAAVCERIAASAKEGIEAAALRELPRQEKLDAGQIRIDVRAAALNFPELLMLQNKYQFKPQVPFVLCTEGAGVVTEVGPRAKKFKPGDRVFFAMLPTLGGCAREEAVLPEEVCHPLPETLSFSQGAGFHMGYATGYHALAQRGKLQPGEWLLVTGAGGGMGIMAVELGKALGARVIAAASSDEKLEACKKVGADFVVNYSKQTLKDAVGEITKGEFCDVIYEPVGGDIFDQSTRCVATRGHARLLVVGFASGRIPQFPANMALIRGFSLVGVRMGHQFAVEPRLADEAMEALLKLANEGKLRPHVGSEYPLDRFKEALRLMEERRVVGKCCLVMGGARASAKL